MMKTSTGPPDEAATVVGPMDLPGMRDHPGSGIVEWVQVVDGQKIEALIREMREWPPGEQPSTVQELSDRYELPPHVIQRIARSEGLTLKVGEVVSDEAVDGHSPTHPMEPVQWPKGEGDEG